MALVLFDEVIVSGVLRCTRRGTLGYLPTSAGQVIPFDLSKELVAFPVTVVHVFNC